MRFLRCNQLYALVGCFMAIILSSCGYLGSVPPLTDADDNTVVNVGDSIFALSGDIYTELHNKAGKTFRHYAVSGTQMVGGIMGPSIPRQYQMAKNDDPFIKTVYMNGGGNDVLLPAMMFDPYKCKTRNYFFSKGLSQKCKNLIDDVYVDRINLFNEMKRDGVEQVVYLGYFPPTRGLFGDLSTLEEASAYGNASVDKSCQATSVNCVFIDPTNAFKGNESTYITSDGIHPTKAGSKVLANMIWEKLTF